MPSFFETRFGPVELEIIDIVLKSWRTRYGLAKDDPDSAIAAEICLNLFREGHKTLLELVRAMDGHKALADIAAAHDLSQIRRHASG
jgi:hypothetical protein